MKILLVDDDALLRNMYATKFTEHGDQVTTAENGPDALRQLQKESFDIVIMDMVMPAMTGVELVKAIKADKEISVKHCVILSNQSESSDIEAAKAAGADGYIIKAETIPSEVVAKIHALVH